MSERTASVILIWLCFFVVLEGLSWETKSWPGPCIVQAGTDLEGGSNNRRGECPTFHEGLGILSERLDSFVERHVTSIVTAFTIVFAVSSIGLWLATIRLWRASDEQRKLSERNAAERSRETRILQRAYLSVEPAGVQPYIAEPGSPEDADRVSAVLSFRNAGNLPARDVVWSINCAVDDAEDRDFVDIPEADDFVSGPVVIAPRGEMTQTTEPFKRTQKERFIYVWGEVRYDDGFGGAPKRTRFCHRYNRMTYQSIEDSSFFGGRQGIPAEYARIYKRGNDAS